MTHGDGGGGGKGAGAVDEGRGCAIAVVRTLHIDTSPLRTRHLVGLVVKASASRAEDPGFESRLRRDFFGVESYQ